MCRRINAVHVGPELIPRYLLLGDPLYIEAALWWWRPRAEPLVNSLQRNTTAPRNQHRSGGSIVGNSLGGMHRSLHGGFGHQQHV